MLPFFGGMASGAGKELGDQDDRAFRLKLQNAQIEGQLANEKSMADYNSASMVATSDMSDGKETGRANTQTQAWYMSKDKNNAARTRGGRSGAKYDREALISAVIKNPVAYNDLTATAKADIFPDLQKQGFKRLDKALTGELQVRADNSLSGLDAIERVNVKIKSNPEDFKKLYAPGTIGAKNLRGDLGEIIDVVKRIRSGAATNGNEDGMYEAQIMASGLSDMLDDVIDGSFEPDSINYRLNTIYKPYLARMANVQQRRRTEEVVSKEEQAKRDAPKGYAGMNTDEKMSLLMQRIEAKKKLREAQEKAANKGKAL